MKSIALLLSLLVLTSIPGYSNPLKRSEAQLDAKIVAAQARFAALQADPKKAIPAVILRSARGIIILREMKAGLGFGVDAGGGVALIKRPDGVWSAPGFVSAGHASWGFQFGAQDRDIIMVLLTEKGLDLLRAGIKGNVGVEYQATVGPVNVNMDLDTTDLAPILIYSDATGGFAGISLKGGGIVGAKIKNQTYYDMSLQDILFSGQAPISESAEGLIKAITTSADRTQE